MSGSGYAKLIDRVPEVLLAFLVNGLGFTYRMNRYSSRMRRILVEWQSLERLDMEVIRLYQLERLRHIARAAAKTPYYNRVFQKTGFNADTITSLDDLKRLPLLEKADLMRHGDEMVVPGYKDRLIHKRSSGTTGQPVAFTQPRAMAYDQGFAMLYQFYGWYGFPPLGRRATMAGRYMGHKPAGVVVRNFFENQLLLGVHSLSEQSIERYLSALTAFRPQMLQAHPSALLLFKQLAEKLGLQPPDVPLVSYTAENMSHHERRILSDWLGGAVIFGTYGSGENVIAASECIELNGYHIHPAIGIGELVEIDGHSEIVGSSLLNDAMPLLRYRTGDFALDISNAPCPCGCTWPRLMSIQGRVDDLIYASNGTPVAPVVLRTGISALRMLESPYSIIQHHTPKHYTLLLYGEPGHTCQENIDAVLNYIRSILGPDCELGVRYTSRDELLTARAKHKIIIKEHR